MLEQTLHYCLIDVSPPPRPDLMSDCWCVQAKLVKFRTDSLEGGTLIEQLSAQARQDTALIREQADKIDELQQQLHSEKVRPTW